RPGAGQCGGALHLYAVLTARRMRILGLSAFYHDSDAAIVEDGKARGRVPLLHDIEVLAIGDYLLRKELQNPALKRDYKHAFLLDQPRFGVNGTGRDIFPIDHDHPLLRKRTLQCADSSWVH